MSAIPKQMIEFCKTLCNRICDGLPVLEDDFQNMKEGSHCLFPCKSEENQKYFDGSIKFIKKIRKIYTHAVAQDFVTLEQVACVN